MLFNSTNFVVFFVVVYGLYLVLQRRSQNLLLLAASYFFYGAWDWRFLSLLLISTVVDYGCAIQIVDWPSRKRFFLWLSLGSNLAMLGFFKYYGFFASSLADLLRELGIQPHVALLDVVLPVGISFYTFQTMSYVIDVYRGDLAPSRKLLDFALFVSFFPQLVAGPIERATHLLPQVQRERTITEQMVRDGCCLILLGFFKKVVIADNMAPISEAIFKTPHGVSAIDLMIGTYAFAFQIYGDFSGYSDIARGISKLMGFELMLNFRMPYLATNPREFWNRWHISLSTWLRDYLYVLLGGSRLGTRKTYRNLMVTMLLGGLWHGAAWSFVFWGLYQGTILVIHRLWHERFGKTAAPRSALGQATAIILYFQVTCFGWILFAIRSLGDMPVLFSRIFTDFSVNQTALLTLIIFAAPMIALDVAQEYFDDVMVVRRLSPARRLVVYASAFVAILWSGAIDGREFIYFQF